MDSIFYTVFGKFSSLSKNKEIILQIPQFPYGESHPMNFLCPLFVFLYTFTTGYHLDRRLHHVFIRNIGISTVLFFFDNFLISFLNSRFERGKYSDLNVN